MAYNTANEPLSESFSGGTLSGLSVTNGYDQYLRRSQLAALNSTTPFLQHSFSFDNASRLLTVTDNTGSPASYSATYIYLAKSPLVSQIVFKQGTTTRMTTAKQHDYLNRLTSISSAVGSSAIGNSYACNNANQRIRSTLADGSYWLYEYDSLGQVRSGRKYWPDQTPVAGQQFEYTHDDIGNRTATKAGGDQNGANLRSASYLANNLNQYTNRTVPGAVDVMGVSFATNAVTVNGQTAYRKGEYFRKEIPVSNGSVPVWQSVTNAAIGQASITGNVFVPKTPELFYYDADGNLTNDGCWRYAWDAENRVVTLTTNTAVGPRQSIKFEYDWRGRRIHKQVWPNASWNGTPTNDVKFVYDGWNLLAELNATNNAVIRSFMWGSDLSGTSQGAGGVGGLLVVVYKGEQTTNCFVAFDGNGNVAALADAGSTNILAQYEYGPFGEVIRATGPMAKANPFRFSTKYQDDETDLLYYGHRYYNASTGRWLSRDPIQEQAGLNLYAFVGNDSVCAIDALGLAKLRFKVIVGIWSGFSGTWSQPYWAGSGDYETGDSFAWSLVNINNEASWLDHLWYCAAYCNSVNVWGGVASAGTIKVYAKDDCGGKFHIRGMYNATITATGPAVTYGHAELNSIEHGQLSTIVAKHASPMVHGLAAVDEDVTLRPKEEKLVYEYVPFTLLKNREFSGGVPSYVSISGSLLGFSITKSP